MDKKGLRVVNTSMNGIRVVNSGDSGGSVEEKDPIFNAKLPELALKKDYRTSVDQDNIDKGQDTKITDLYSNYSTLDAVDKHHFELITINKGNINVIGEQMLDMIEENIERDKKISILERKPDIAAKMFTITKEIDNVTSSSVNLTFQDDVGYFSNNNILTVKNGALNNSNIIDSTNVIRIHGELQFKMTGLISAVTTITISCPDDLTLTPKTRQFTIQTASAFSIGFDFIIPGDKNTTTINVKYSSLAGLTSRQILPSAILFEKLK